MEFHKNKYNKHLTQFMIIPVILDKTTRTKLKLLLLSENLSVQNNNNKNNKHKKINVNSAENIRK